MLAQINASYPSFVPDKPAAYCRHLTGNQVLAKLLYALKAPQKRYRVFRPRGFLVSRTTGEISQKPARIQKDWLRTGQRVRMCRIMADRYLDRLLFGQGEGTKLCRDIREDALASFYAHHQPHE
jgi:hypothetical protein